jgi:hypothetical protein
MQYSATVSGGFLQKLNEPFHQCRDTLQIHQHLIPIFIEMPSALYSAILNASHAPNLASGHVTGSLKRKAMSNITDVANNKIPKLNHDKDQS